MLLQDLSGRDPEVEKQVDWSAGVARDKDSSQRKLELESLYKDGYCKEFYWWILLVLQQGLSGRNLGVEKWQVYWDQGVEVEGIEDQVVETQDQVVETQNQVVETQTSSRREWVK